MCLVNQHHEMGPYEIAQYVPCEPTLRVIIRCKNFELFHLKQMYSIWALKYFSGKPLSSCSCAIIKKLTTIWLGFQSSPEALASDDSYMLQSHLYYSDG